MRTQRRRPRRVAPAALPPERGSWLNGWLDAAALLGMLAMSAALGVQLMC